MFQLLGSAIPLENIVILSITQQTRRLGVDDLSTEGLVHDSMTDTSKEVVNADVDRDRTTTNKGLTGEERRIGIDGRENSIKVLKQEERKNVVDDSNQRDMDSRQHLLGSR